MGLIGELKLIKVYILQAPPNFPSLKFPGFGFVHFVLQTNMCTNLQPWSWAMNYLFLSLFFVTKVFPCVTFVTKVFRRWRTTDSLWLQLAPPYCKPGRNQRDTEIWHVANLISTQFLGELIEFFFGFSWDFVPTNQSWDSQKGEKNNVYFAL